MNKVLKLLLAGNYLWYFGAGLFGPLYAVFAESIGGNVLDLTGAYAVYLIVTGVLSMYIGKISDHHHKKYLMICGFALNAVATFGYLLVDTPLKLFMVEALFGVAVALATPTWDSLFSSHVDKKHGGEEWGLLDGGYYIISGISILIGGLIITYFSFTALFIIMGTIQVVGTLIESGILKKRVGN